MTMKSKLIVRHSRQVAFALCGLLMIDWSFQSCKDDDAILTGQPDWLGNSIYDRLKEDPDGQQYTTLLRLIDDLGQAEVLRHTGSKTIFAADDDAFNRWFNNGNNKWGVKNYEALTKAQKSMLLNTCMVNNAYLIELLSNSAGNPPTKGGSMRRLAATSIYDSVTVINPDVMPATLAWKQHQGQGKQMHIMMDATEAPIIHLLPEFMRVNKFTDVDVDKLTNGQSSSVNTAWVNGVQITKQNITCKNGYIHKVANVPEPLTNMAQIVRDNPEMSRWASLLDRFSAPYYNRAVSQEYNRLNGTKDSVFSLRYISSRSVGGTANEYLPDDRTTLKGLLTFDPGWNQYVPDVSNTDYHNDAGAMLVPTNDALERWWQSGSGKPIRVEYKDWDNIPDDILADLLNNNLQSSFLSSIPSNFSNIVDDAMMPMHGDQSKALINPGQVVKTYMGCNGVVYLMNDVFAPSIFSSVAFPAQVNKTMMNVFYWAIENLDGGAFKSLLSSMEATYSMFLPTNSSMLTYVDPTLYGTNTMVLYQFYYDNDSTLTADERVKAKRYEMTRSDASSPWTCKSFEIAVTTKTNIIKNRMKDLLNSMIIVGKLNPNQEYYRTRGGSTVRIKYADTPAMTIEGGYQLESHLPIVGPDGMDIDNNVPLAIDSTFEMGNGISYQISAPLPLSSTNSVGSILKDKVNHPEFYDFYELMSSSGLFTSTLKGSFTDESGASSQVDAKPNKGHENISLFDGYHYTVYVPQSSAIKALQAKGYLPTKKDIDDAKNSKYGSASNVLIAKNVMRQRMKDFVSYHIQDNSVFIGGEPTTDKAFESSKVNPVNNRFFSLKVTSTPSDLKVWGQLKLDADCNPTKAIDDNGNSIPGQNLNVITTVGCYNLMAREFWNSSNKAEAYQLDDQDKQIYSTNDAVVHLIDGALIYNTDQLTPWLDEILNTEGFDMEAYRKVNPTASRKK